MERPWRRVANLSSDLFSLQAELFCQNSFEGVWLGCLAKIGGSYFDLIWTLLHGNVGRCSILRMAVDISAMWPKSVPYAALQVKKCSVVG